MSGADAADPVMSLIRLAAAVALALPLGWERKARSASAGLRTYALVAMGTCAFVLTGQGALGASPDEQADVLFGIVTGVGFIGGGAVLKDPETLRGMVTAVSLWVTVAIATAAAHGLYVLAFAMSLLTLVSLQLRGPAPKEEPS